VELARQVRFDGEEMEVWDPAGDVACLDLDDYRILE